jgi:rod shape-determining protein MreC
LAAYRRSSRTRNVLAVLVLSALTLVTIDARSNGGGVLSDIRTRVGQVFAPLQDATHSALRPIGNFLSGALRYGSLEHQNQLLRQQLAQDANGAAQAQAEQSEAEEVLRDQGLTWLGGIPTVTAQITDVGSSNFERTLTIDRGTTSGVALGQPVVAAGGLVGSVTAVSATTAIVDVLTDPSFDVGVSLAGGNTGFAAGSGPGQPLKVTVIPPTAGPGQPGAPPPAEKVGMVLVTSGLQGEKFPRGIPVGRVSKVTTSPGAVEPDIGAVPLVNPSQLAYVDVLLWSPQ